MPKTAVSCQVRLVPHNTLALVEVANKRDTPSSGHMEAGVAADGVDWLTSSPTEAQIVSRIGRAT